jgi:threonine/homoserine/homoserine lactone efflux protein
MFDLSIFIRGAIIGLGIAAPVGPIAILCMRRTIQRGMQYGFMTGMGAAVADAIYGAIAAFGVAAVSDFLERNQNHLMIIGGLVIIGLSIRVFFTKLKLNTDDTQSPNLLRAFVTSLMLTMTNPMTILAFIAVIAGLGLSNVITQFNMAVIFVLGVLAGSSIWWLFLSSIVGVIRHMIDEKVLLYINRAAGVVLLGFGCYALISGLLQFPFFLQP